MGIDRQVVSITPTQYYYWAPPDLGAEVAALQNDALAHLAAGHPDRLTALGTLPMQSPDAAVAELRRIVTSHGFPGVAVNPSAGGVDYDHPDYEEFWTTVHELDVLVMLHPNGTVDGRRLGDYYLINVVGNPLETTVALARIVLGGIPERYPGIKILAVHGGGYLPFYMDRMDHAARARPDVAHRISAPPSELLRRLYFDTVVHGAGLAHLVALLGPDHLVLGTDYPYDMGVADPLDRIGALGLDAADEAAIRGGNAARLLGSS
jgi:aminocarboxymuconate-semialdehyde decarboxylase